MSKKTPEKTIHAVEALFDAGKTRHEIAALLGLSYNTVKGLLLAYLTTQRQKEREPAPPPEQKELPLTEKELPKRLTRDDLFELIDNAVRAGHKVCLEIFDE